MEYRLVPLKLLEKLHKIMDEECEVNLRLALEQAIKSPNLSMDNFSSSLQKDINLYMEEVNFYL